MIPISLFSLLLLTWVESSTRKHLIFPQSQKNSMDINVNSDIEKEYRGVKQNSYNSSNLFLH